MIDDIYYLAQPWRINPHQSFYNAVKWTYQLREMGYYIFSPILHTHPYWNALVEKTEQQYKKEEDWVEWDLKIMEALIPHIIILMSNTAYRINNRKEIGWLSLGCRLEYLFAVEKNIKIYELEAFLNGHLRKINGGT